MNKHLLKIAASALVVLSTLSCSKNEIDAPPVVTPPPTTGSAPVVPGVDPQVATTIGFFLDTWLPKTYTAPAFTEGTVPATASNTVTVDASDIITKIPTQIFAHNANTWMGTFVDQPSFITDITNLKPNIIRWPAGSGSDVYFWNVKPGDIPEGAPTKYLDKDGKVINASFFYGRSTDNWRASLDNYYSMLQMSNSKGIITVNYGFARYGISANPVATAAHLAADWVRYDKGRTQYWEVGNENYGDWEAGYRIDVTKNKDGQPEFLTGKLYAQHFKVFADSMRKAAAEVGNAGIKIGAVIQESPTASWQTNTTQTWNSTLIPELNNKEDFFIAHNYITPYGEKSNAATVLNSALSVPASMMSFITNQVKNNGGELKPIAFTEWNMWAQDLKQQVSNTSGLFAVIVQSEAIKNKFGLAARWDLLNGWEGGNDHGLFSDGGSADDPRWNPRPSFYYMYYFQKSIGDRLVSTTVEGAESAAVKAYASTYSSGQVNINLLNTSSKAQAVTLKFKNFNAGSRYYWYSLEGSNDNGEFSRKVLVNNTGPSGAAGGPASYATLKAMSAATTNGVKVNVPAYGAVFVMVDK
ncbi:alpha-L-arabinofuranosidase [Segetibacter aerophilus]|uniref:Alpha-L-arabinofuranosidase n=1 Tax=Segetibacter aerophilus TaxID=670293 RepID=A0A512BHA0_9BACT|nr:alpha-L-arabinofuranosidase [Segetibacter aerophilus]GEO11255.1 hypothetical protein SAE01_37510 [Segetibacter aerophilus]